MEIIEKIKAKIKKIFQKTPKKIRKGIAIGTLAVASAGAVASCRAEKDAQEDNYIKQQNDFKERIKEQIKKQEKQASELSYVERANQLKTAEEVEDLLKDMYIEQHEKETGDTTLTTEDIQFKGKINQDYVYVNQKTGDMITHGEKPEETEQKLKRDGISYKRKGDIDIYKVMDKDGKGLEGITLQIKGEKELPIKVILADQYDNKQDTSILVKMGGLVPATVDYINYIKKGDENDIAVSKVQFLKEVEEFESQLSNQKQVGEGREHE